MRRGDLGLRPAKLAFGFGQVPLGNVRLLRAAARGFTFAFLALGWRRRRTFSRLGLFLFGGTSFRDRFLRGGRFRGLRCFLGRLFEAVKLAAFFTGAFLDNRRLRGFVGAGWGHLVRRAGRREPKKRDESETQLLVA